MAVTIFEKMLNILKMRCVLPEKILEIYTVDHQGQHLSNENETFVSSLEHLAICKGSELFKREHCSVVCYYSIS